MRENELPIRQMTVDDYDEVYRLWDQTDGLSLDEGDGRGTIALYLKRNQGLCFVAVDSGCIIGAALCGHEGRRGILRHLVVDPLFRRRGIARSLVTECLSTLAHVGITKCNTFVLYSNVEGRRFWNTWDGICLRTTTERCKFRRNRKSRNHIHRAARDLAFRAAREPVVRTLL